MSNYRDNLFKKRRVIFAGTAPFALPTLQALVQDGWNVISVFTQPDRPSGRGRKLQSGPIKTYALEQSINVFQPHTLKDADNLARIRELDPELLVVVAYGLILPSELLTIPCFGCINIHASVLPRWRGAAPIQRAIEAGDVETGISIMLMDEGLDTGPILSIEKIKIHPNYTAGELYDELAVLGAHSLQKILPSFLAGELVPKAQPNDGVTYAEKLSKKDALINWTSSAEQILRKIRAFNPWPVAYVDSVIGPIRILAANIQKTVTRCKPGDIISANKNGIVVGCGDAALNLTLIQLPGKTPMNAADLLNGHSALFNVGTAFGV